MPSKTIKAALKKIKNTPFHPQWLVFKQEEKNLKNICRNLNGLVIDIGSAGKKPKKLINDQTTYIGLDYPTTADNWYKTQPNIYGDAQELPFHESCADNVLLLDVLEHIPSPHECMQEINRTLKPNGKLWIQVPFMYPIHDAPLDFQRWTEFGFNELAKQHGFSIISKKANGGPVETASILMNIAISKAVLNWMKAKNPLALLIFLLPAIVFIINIFGYLSSLVCRDDPMMPTGYTMTWKKVRQ